MYRYLNKNFEDEFLKKEYASGPVYPPMHDIFNALRYTAFKDVKVVIIDTLNALMVADEVRRMKEKGFDKWVDLAASVYEIVDYALTVRDDLTVIFLCHTQTEHTDDGFTFTHIKTSGKKLDKIVLESKFPVVLHAKVIDGEHKFETRADFSTAKTPLGAFEEQYIENDIVKVLEALKEY